MTIEIKVNKGSISGCTCVWDYLYKMEDYYNISNSIKVLYKIVDGKLQAQVYVSLNSWYSITFEVLSEYKLRERPDTDWTLYDTTVSDSLSALPSEYTIVNVSLATLANKVATASISNQLNITDTLTQDEVNLDIYHQLSLMQLGIN